jgi:hypothetical protein
VSGLIVACSTSQKTIVVPVFSIAVKLSETAQKKLQAMHESVLVIAYFYGDLLPGKGKDNSPMTSAVPELHMYDGDGGALIGTYLIFPCSYRLTTHYRQTVAQHFL